MIAEFVHVEGDALLVRVDLGIYGISALLRAAYVLTDRCFVHLEYRSDRLVDARFRKKPGAVEDVEVLAREFCNQLLDFTLRAQIAEETENERNLILAHALSRHHVLNPELEQVPAFADPLGVSAQDRRK